MTNDELPEMVERIRNILLVTLRPLIAIANERAAREACALAAHEVLNVMTAPNDAMIHAMNIAAFVDHEFPEDTYKAAIAAALGRPARPATSRDAGQA
jgi:hypothetical protein